MVVLSFILLVFEDKRTVSFRSVLFVFEASMLSTASHCKRVCVHERLNPRSKLSDLFCTYCRKLAEFLFLQHKSFFVFREKEQGKGRGQHLREHSEEDDLDLGKIFLLADKGFSETKTSHAFHVRTHQQIKLECVGQSCFVEGISLHMCSASENQSRFGLGNSRKCFFASYSRFEQGETTFCSGKQHRVFLSTRESVKQNTHLLMLCNTLTQAVTMCGTCGFLSDILAMFSVSIFITE